MISRYNSQQFGGEIAYFFAGLIVEGYKERVWVCPNTILIPLSQIAAIFVFTFCVGGGFVLLQLYNRHVNKSRSQIQILPLRHFIFALFFSLSRQKNFPPGSQQGRQLTPVHNLTILFSIFSLVRFLLNVCSVHLMHFQMKSVDFFSFIYCFLLSGHLKLKNPIRKTKWSHQI